MTALFSEYPEARESVGKAIMTERLKVWQKNNRNKYRPAESPRKDAGKTHALRMKPFNEMSLLLYAQPDSLFYMETLSKQLPRPVAISAGIDDLENISLGSVKSSASDNSNIMLCGMFVISVQLRYLCRCR